MAEVNYEELYKQSLEENKKLQDDLKKSQEDTAKFKKSFDETASQVAALKREKEEKMSDEEKAKAEKEKANAELAELKRENAFYKYSQTLSPVIKDEEVLKNVATLYSEGKTDEAIKAQNEYLVKEHGEIEKRIKEGLLKAQPEPHPQGEPTKRTTKEDYLSSPEGIDELDELAKTDPAAYKKIIAQ